MKLLTVLFDDYQDAETQDLSFEIGREAHGHATDGPI